MASYAAAAGHHLLQMAVLIVPLELPRPEPDDLHSRNGRATVNKSGGGPRIPSHIDK